ncbi:hypothetical protein R69927_02246 [Paraburkholderia domus]|jgi:hypothetical protein|uniref:Uncharacterized protein n=1 Tax=Paraburkholderia domus TaxID=2793075 RepID=A0A9N8MV33_9BURK|nr:hypothetical protein [Paraburkholderia domus]MBK5054384.1 hypothetical protein [Burkholderia sp. R-70006]MBK5064204.1 hypothetical protein [Burkholderia sp. R-70199]MBK5086837.1 hypothetical protein [Burkholderia sp. R-69927]MBK5121560.1 hypothetical protein [Burkholderia sp. R-69980]MBK5166703.1 hypothetical protein [Burkholderia sp. R-70211]MBK5186546.1 hypothetical protein [Burkholderia sp. R-69749]MCI0151701.1 hypothetical protein [Paraburkholderia sediminicola]
MRHIPVRPEQTQSPVSSETIAVLRTAKVVAQDRLADALRNLSRAQSKFQQTKRTERAAVLTYIEAYNNATEGRHD